MHRWNMLRVNVYRFAFALSHSLSLSLSLSRAHTHTHTLLLSLFLQHILQKLFKYRHNGWARLKTSQKFLNGSSQ